MKTSPLIRTLALIPVFYSLHAIAADNTPSNGQTNPPAKVDGGFTNTGAPSASVSNSLGASVMKSENPDQTGLPETKEHRDESMSWWRDATFGLFIHWGAYAVPGHGESYMSNQKIPIADYARSHRDRAMRRVELI